MRLDRLSRLGSHFYEEHFGYNYVKLESLSVAKDEDWVLMPDGYCLIEPIDVSGLDIAIVGNAKVRNFGCDIDGRDAVIRINYPYHWKREKKDDGIKFTHWCGLGKNEVFFPELFHNPPIDSRMDSISELMSLVGSLNCISHHHVQKKFLNAICDFGVLDKLNIYYSTPLIFDLIDRSFLGRDRVLQSWITNRVYNEIGYGGWFGWDLLFSGVKTVMLCAISRPKSIFIYGMDFYESASNRPWDMHNINLNREVLFKVGHLCREFGIKFEILPVY